MDMSWPIQPQPRSKPRLSRTSVPKVRTGCMTCKKRHIKCDEAKPSCNNCIKNRGYCEGYGDKIQPGSTSLSPQHRYGTADPMVQLQLDPDLLDFSDNNSMLYFQEFIQLLQGQWMAETSARHFWSVVMPQVIRANSTLRHAAIAVGALSMWRGQRGSELLLPRSIESPSWSQQNNHWTNALTYYGKSLRQPANGLSLQDTLLLSVLLIHFETLQGNRQAAIDHVNHGLALFLVILTNATANGHKLGVSSNSRSTPLLKDLASIFLNLETQTRLILRGKVGHSSPLPNFSKTLKMQHQTIESFSYLLNIALVPKNANLDCIPAVFSNLDDFEECMSSMQCRQNTIVPIMLETFRHSGMLETNDHQEILSSLLQILQDPRIKDFCEESVKIMKKLETAFLPLFNEIILKDINSPEYLRALQLRLQYLGIYIFDNVPQYLDISAMQALTPFCYEFVSLASRIVHMMKRQIRNAAHYMSLQSTLAFRLLSTATLCRDPLGREGAIDILRDYPCQDGLWNVRSFYVLALRNRFVEQQNAIEDTPAIQWTRLWRREYVFEDGGDSILFRFLVKNNDSGSWELVEETGQVGEDLENVQWIRRPLTAEGKLLMGSLMPWDNT